MASNAAVQLNTSFEISKAITINRFFAKVKLSASARLVLRCLIDFYNNKDGKRIYPAQSTVAECTGCSRQSVNNAVDELRNNDLITTIGKSGSNLVYSFTPKFFEMLEILQPCQKTLQVPVKKFDTINKYSEQINEHKGNLLNFSNRQATYRHDTATKGINYPKAEIIDHVRDERTPENNLETAQKFVDELWSMRENYLVKAKLEKVLAIWGKEKFEQFQDVPQNLQGCKNCASENELNYSSQF